MAKKNPKDESVFPTLTCINLIQPWADAVIDGLFPVLVRKQNVKKRGIIGIRSTEGMDRVFLSTLNNKEFVIAENKLTFGKVIGTINLVDCYPVSKNEVHNKLRKILGEDNFPYYPTYFIPESEKVYFWLLEDPVRFQNPLEITSCGIAWSKAQNYGATKKHTGKDTFWKMGNFSRYLEFNKSNYR